MRLIQKYLPFPQHTEIHRIYVKALPSDAWEEARHFDMGQISWVRLLFDIRTLPQRIKGDLKETDRRIGVDQIAESNNGFLVLEEKPGREVIVGAIGKFWQVNIPFKKVTPGEFIDYNELGYGKLAWSISVEPYCNGSTISLELRTTATDTEAWRKLSRYYHVIGIGSKLIRRSLLHHIGQQLGKMRHPSKRNMVLPGDDLIPDKRYQATYIADIEAPVSIVWQYLMRLGCDRAGWYTQELTDTGDKPGMDHLVKDWEQRKTGDRLQCLPSSKEYFEVYDLKANSYLLVGTRNFLFGNPYEVTWVFALEQIGEDATRLVTRARMSLHPAALEWTWGRLVGQPLHSLMQKTQLKNLKRICESEAQKRVFKQPEYQKLIIENEITV